MKIRSTTGIEYRGALGKSVIRSSWKGRPYERAYAVPANPRSVLQRQQRGFLAEGVKAWKGLRPSQRTFYERLAGPERITGYNLFLRRYIAARRRGETPEVPVVLQVTRETGEVPVGTRFVVTRGDLVLFRDDLQVPCLEIALTPSDAPFTVLLARGTEASSSLTLHTLESSSLPRVLQVERLIASIHLDKDGNLSHGPDAPTSNRNVLHATERFPGMSERRR